MAILGRRTLVPTSVVARARVTFRGPAFAMVLPGFHPGVAAQHPGARAARFGHVFVSVWTHGLGIRVPRLDLFTLPV